jgi:hypothetical protein
MTPTEAQLTEWDREAGLFLDAEAEVERDPMEVIGDAMRRVRVLVAEVSRLRARIGEVEGERNYLDGVNSGLLGLANERQNEIARLESSLSRAREALGEAEWALVAMRRVMGSVAANWEPAAVVRYDAALAGVRAALASGDTTATPAESSPPSTKQGDEARPSRFVHFSVVNSAIGRVLAGDTVKSVREDWPYLEPEFLWTAKAARRTWERRVRALTEALAPFAAVSAMDMGPDYMPENEAFIHWAGFYPLTWGDVRRAAAALSGDTTTKGDADGH